MSNSLRDAGPNKRRNAGRSADFPDAFVYVLARRYSTIAGLPLEELLQSPKVVFVILALVLGAHPCVESNSRGLSRPGSLLQHVPEHPRAEPVG